LTDAFKQGFFEVQDANSQLVAAFLDVKPGCVSIPVQVAEKPCIASLMENKVN
jgi:16S rRNA (cytosine967-C5)-methyltransferase